MKTAFLTAATAACTLPVLAMAEAPGFKLLSFDAPHHGRAVSGGIWYPADGDEHHTVMAENPVFFGVDVAEDAALEPGNHPIVLLSHGLGGHIRSLAWLAADLAERGAVVIAVNHPNSSWGDFDMDIGLNHWTRTEDLSLALDTILDDPDFGPALNPDRIMAAGFSYGGWTALSMAGLQGNLSGYAAHCDAYVASSTHCRDLEQGGIDLDSRAAQDWNASYKDSRITHVAAIDPAFVWGLTPADAADVGAEVTLFGLGEGANRLMATDFDQSGFLEVLPQAEVVRLAPAFHFSMLPLCKPAGAAILEDENDDPVCTDPEGADRAQLHKAVADRIAADLGL